MIHTELGDWEKLSTERGRTIWEKEVRGVVATITKSGHAASVHVKQHGELLFRAKYPPTLTLMELKQIVQPYLQD